MSFQNLKVDELKKVAEFFAVDVEPADADKGPTKKELLAALSDGDDPVTWEQYNDIYLKAVADGQDTTKGAEEAEKSDKKDKAEAKDEPVEEKKVSERDSEDQVLVKYERKNPTFEVVGYTFTQKHPFKSVPASVAEHLVRNVEGFRVALPSEVTEYYN